MRFTGSRVRAGSELIIVVDYDAGNLYNVANALRFLGIDFKFSGDPDEVSRADRVILPGVGSARAAMNSLEQQGLTGVIRELDVPFLGICLGLQLLYEKSEEDETPCLGILPGSIRRFDSSTVKVPHIGWNQVDWRESGENGNLLAGISQSAFFYFVHSYYAPVAEDITVATTGYEVTFSSVIRKGNFVGCQFHPERSGEVGLKLFKNFLEV
jgi:glutamine amidotransferase